MPPVSVVIITYNEEKNVRAALESAKWADETVVVDSYSADSTVAICREFTSRVYQEKWRGFSGQKTYAVGLARNDWVFVLDADERITEALADEVRGLMADGPGKDGYRCARRNHFMGKEIKYGGWYPDYTLRLFNRKKGSFRERAVHEAVEVNGEVGCLKNPMLHYTYDGVSDYVKRLDLYSGLAAEELVKAGRRAGPVDVTLRPVTTFIRMYFIKQGLRDGFHGLLLAMLYSFYTFCKYAKLWEMQKHE